MSLYCLKTNIDNKIEKTTNHSDKKKETCNIIISKLGFYLTEEDLSSLARLSNITGKYINVEKYFNIYIIYNILINKKNTLDRETILSYIKDPLGKYNLTYDGLKKNNITDKAIFLMFFYIKSIKQYMDNLKHLCQCDALYYRQIQENKLKRKDTIYMLKISNNKKKQEIVTYNGDQIPDNVEGILQDSNNQSIIELNNGTIEIIDKYTKPIFVHAYCVDVLYIKNGDTTILNNMIGKFKYSSTHIVNQIQLLYGDDVTTQSRIISENDKDSNSESLLNLIYSRQHDGTVFSCGSKTAGVIVVHKQFLVAKKYIYRQKKILGFREIISNFLNNNISYDIH